MTVGLVSGDVRDSGIPDDCGASLRAWSQVM